MLRWRNSREALPQNEAELDRCKRMGIEDINRILRMEDLVKGDDAIFAATGVTDGELLRGVQFKGSVRNNTIPCYACKIRHSSLCRRPP